jgi:DNA mismatch endonuclease (patch repair protein)
MSLGTLGRWTRTGSIPSESTDQVTKKPRNSFANKRIGRPPASSLQARHRMQIVRQRNTEPERALRSALHRLGLRFRIHRRLIAEVRRSVDIVFPRHRVAVFVDGCFWHGCPVHGTMARANKKFWQQKLQTNRQRDKDTGVRLSAAGWMVVRVWEHEDATTAAERIYHILRTRGGRS